jgi:hypothetical protein
MKRYLIAFVALLCFLALGVLPAGAQEAASELPGWGERLRSGGGTVVVQLALSVFAFGYALEHIFRLRRSAIAPAI